MEIIIVTIILSALIGGVFGFVYRPQIMEWQLNHRVQKHLKAHRKALDKD